NHSLYDRFGLFLGDVRCDGHALDQLGFRHAQPLLIPEKATKLSMDLGPVTSCVWYEWFQSSSCGWSSSWTRTRFCSRPPRLSSVCALPPESLRALRSVPSRPLALPRPLPLPLLPLPRPQWRRAVARGQESRPAPDSAAPRFRRDSRSTG